MADGGKKPRETPAGESVAGEAAARFHVVANGDVSTDVHAVAGMCAHGSRRQRPGHAGGNRESPPAPQPTRPMVAVIDAGGRTPYGQAIWQGMQQAAETHELELRRFSAVQLTPAALVEQLELAAASEPSGICVWPVVQDEAVAAQLSVMERSPRPMLLFAQRLVPPPAWKCCYVGTDQFYTGRRLAETVRQRAGELPILLVAARGDQPAAATRQHGFEFTLADAFPEAEVQLLQVDESADLRDQVQQTLGEVDTAAVLVAVEATTTQQLVEAFAADREGGALPRIIGFGAYPGIANHLAEGRLDATLVEDPLLLGSSAISTLFRELEGEPAEYDVATGEHLVTADDLADEATQERLRVNGGGA